ncbi:MAG: WxL domain-containing protein [Thermoleophilaceae bacterium]
MPRKALVGLLEQPKQREQSKKEPRQKRTLPMPPVITLRNLLACAATVASLLAFAPMAGAATSSDTTQFAVTAGSLAFGTAPDAPNLPALTLNGQSQTLNAQMASYAVSDGTGSGSGWNVSVIGDSGVGKSAVFKEYCNSGSACGSVSANSYATGGATLPANSLTLSSSGAAFTAQNGTTGTAPTHQCSSVCNVDSASQSKIVSAAANAGMGTYQANSYGASSLALTAPTTIKTLAANEVFRADLVWSLNSGP